METGLTTGTPVLLPLLCHHCGTCAVPTLGPGAGQHVARALCSNPACSRFIKWLPKALFGGEKAVATMDSVNVCVLSGYLERDPTLRYREDGTAHCVCTIRVEEVRDGIVYKTYVLVEGFGKTAEALAEFHGGAAVLAQGKLFWRRHVTSSGAEKSGLALLAQKISVLVPVAVRTGSTLTLADT